MHQYHIFGLYAPHLVSHICEKILIEIFSLDLILTLEMSVYEIWILISFSGFWMHQQLKSTIMLQPFQRIGSLMDYYLSYKPCIYYGLILYSVLLSKSWQMAMWVFIIESILFLIFNLTLLFSLFYLLNVCCFF